MKNILICGVVKNAENRLTKNILFCKKLGSYFDNFKMIVYENNSTDNTKKILKSFTEIEKNMVVLSEDISDEIIKKNSKVWANTKLTGSDHPCRIEQISNARNKVLQEIRKKQYNDYSVVVWIDLDSNGFTIETVKNSINKVLKNDKMVLFGNSHPRHYDYYALRTDILPKYALGPEVLGEIFWKNANGLHLKLGRLVPVYSAFNGIGIYPKGAFDKNSYDILPNNKVKSVYDLILKKNKVLIEQYGEILKSPCPNTQEGVYDNNSNIYWKYNSGYDNIILCEHVFLNFNLISEGYKLYIDPDINYIWGH